MSIAGLIATCLGVGRSPVAPGTAGSLVALPLGWALVRLGGSAALLAGILLVTIVGIWAAGRYAAETGMDDPGSVVIDEVAGQWIALLAVPLAPLPYALAFVAFRFFDILKPWPVSWADRKLPGGLGIMADDVLAGVYAAAVLTLLQEGWTRWTIS
jgi:phosphatidylglycerophosphatase A